MCKVNLKTDYKKDHNSLIRQTYILRNTVIKIRNKSLGYQKKNVQKCGLKAEVSADYNQLSYATQFYAIYLKFEYMLIHTGIMLKLKIV